MITNRVQKQDAGHNADHEQDAGHNPDYHYEGRTKPDVPADLRGQ
jgi:hypothetical protein